MTGAGFPHSDILGSQLGWQLPEAYRSLLRPSSAPGAKTSTVCPYLLHHTQHDTEKQVTRSRPAQAHARPQPAAHPHNVLTYTPHPHHHSTKRAAAHRCRAHSFALDARIHCAVLKDQPTPTHYQATRPLTPHRCRHGHRRWRGPCNHGTGRRRYDPRASPGHPRPSRGAVPEGRVFPQDPTVH